MPMTEEEEAEAEENEDEDAPQVCYIVLKYYYIALASQYYYCITLHCIATTLLLHFYVIATG